MWQRALRHACIASALTAAGGCWLVLDLEEGEPCPEEPCRLMKPQCGCRQGKMCALRAAERVCVTPDGSAGPEAACAGPFDCEPGNMCAIYGGAPATCTPFCRDDADCAPPAGLCVRPLLNGSGDVAEMLCSTACSPLATAPAAGGCGLPGAKCVVEHAAGSSARWYTTCVGLGAGVQGATCVASRDCARGLACIDFGGSSSCAAYCVRPNGGCPSGLSCVGLAPAATIGALEYGVCH